ncbi:MAG: hypothetical protein IPG56_17935 [Caulobacteraceae bacterium]|nr:hypothetical protein [Caulobacteraceae bacterium]
MGLEIDEFDSEEAMYLIDVDANGDVQQSARLLPTLSPHLMSEVFAKLCDDGPPRSARVWGSIPVLPRARHCEGRAASRNCWRE